MYRDKPLHNFLFETDIDGFYDNLSTYCTPWIDTCCLLHLIRKRSPKTLLEIGTHKGYTTRTLASKFPGMQIVTVDPGDKVSLENRPGNQKGEYLPQSEIGMLCSSFPNVTILKDRFDYIDFDTKFDFIFIDGDHRFDAVMKDSLKSFSLLNEKGTVVWHDATNVKDVDSALAELSKEREICRIHNTWIAYYCA